MPDLKKTLVDEAKTITTELYKDLAKPTVTELGNIAGRTAKALLAPIRGFLWGWELIEKVVEGGVTKRLEKVPEERRKSPEPEIAVPLIQALSYTAQNETLREMYINLLANSMDTAKESVVHPSFVEIIKQMNSLDAKVFDKLSKEGGYQKIFCPEITIKGTNQYFTNMTPYWYMGWTIDGYNEFDVSASFVRLSKFGLIELLYDRTATKGYDEIKNQPFLQNILSRARIMRSEEIELEGKESVVHVNEYGRQFKIACQQ